MIRIMWLLCVLFSLSQGADAQTIAEKRVSIGQGSGGFGEELRQPLERLNQELAARRIKLKRLYQQGERLSDEGADEEQLTALLEQVGVIKQQMILLQQEWQQLVSESKGGQAYGLWSQPVSTIGQLVMDYGSQEFVYVIDPEVASLKVNVSSFFPVPRQVWTELLDSILLEQGVAVRQVSPFVRHLYLAKEGKMPPVYMSARREELQGFPSGSQICFLLTEESGSTPSALQLLRRAMKREESLIQVFGGGVFLFGEVGEVQEWVKLYDFASRHNQAKEYRLFPLRKFSAEEMEKILLKVTAVSGEEQEDALLQTLVLKTFGEVLFVAGSTKQVEHAAQLVQEVERQVASAQEKRIFWYKCRHTEAEELAEVLGKVYEMLIAQGGVTDEERKESSLPPYYAPYTPFPQETGLVIDPSNKSQAPSGSAQNGTLSEWFVVDPKSGSIIMVVEDAFLPQLKQLLKKLDRPKRMVRLDILLVEKRLVDNSRMGMNMLKVGSSASGQHTTGAIWKIGEEKSSSSSSGQGILDFFINRAKSSRGIPAYDLAYNFLASQEDVRINANPSIITVNQTAARIDLQDEVSVNTGAVEGKHHDHSKNIRETYERKQFGIHIEITPTIHQGEEDPLSIDTQTFVTLRTQINFDTQRSNIDNRPNVFRRQINNEVRIPHGETVVLGGLMQKDSQNSKSGLPFLGDIPGVGKLFGTTGQCDISTEMLIFITPTVVEDSRDGLERLRKEELKRRPGDTPEFLNHLMQARLYQREHLVEQSLDQLLGS